MQTPAFWRHDGLTAHLLAPIGTLYDAGGVLRRMMTVPQRVRVPVLCVGNATVGGTGKTPVAIDLARRLHARGLNAHLLTRGYGGRGGRRAPLLVEPMRHTVDDVGDEALLLARAAPTWVSPDRAAGARAAVEAGAQAVVMDDGFQNPGLAKDLSLLVVDAAVGVGNGRVLPAGPLREALPRALARADATVLMGPNGQDVAGRLDTATPVLRADLMPAECATALRGRSVLAFAGIGRPAKFFDTMRCLGACLVESVGFADHHRYTDDELRRLIDRAAAAGATLVTTEKDTVRLPAWARAEVATVPVRVVWKDATSLEKLLDGLVEQRAASD